MVRLNFILAIHSNVPQLTYSLIKYDVLLLVRTGKALELKFPKCIL